MVNAIRQRVTVRPGGVIEVVAPEIQPGTEAEVIVLLESPNGPSTARNAPAALKALDALQAGLNLQPDAAHAWSEQARIERQASSARREALGS